MSGSVYSGAIVNAHAEGNEMKTINWMQSIVMRISTDLYRKLMNTN